VGFARDPEQLGDARRLLLVRVPRLDRLAEARVGGLADAVDRNRLAGGTGARRERVAARRPTGRRGEERAAAAPRRRQARAAEHAEDDAAVLDQAERHRILLAAQEALGAVDRIERPVAAPARVGPAAVDPAEHLLGLRTAADLR